MKANVGRRQAITHILAGEGRQLIGGREDLAWLLESNRADAEAGRVGILAELGRLAQRRGDVEALEAAAWCCRTRPSSKVAIRVLRGWRGAPRGRRLDVVHRLQSAIVAAVNEACAADPDLTPEAALLAAREALDAIVVHTPVSAA